MKTKLASLQATSFAAAALAASSLLSRPREAYDFSRQRYKSRRDDLCPLGSWRLTCIVAEIESQPV